MKDILNTAASDRLAQEIRPTQPSEMAVSPDVFRSPQAYMWYLARTHSPLLTGCRGQEMARCNQELIEQCDVMLATPLSLAEAATAGRETVGEFLSSLDTLPLREEGFDEFVEKICHSPYPIAGRRQNFQQFKTEFCRNSVNQQVWAIPPIIEKSQSDTYSVKQLA